jgi:hypothetical protein
MKRLADESTPYPTLPPTFDARPYRPGWLDYLYARINALPMPNWVFYLVLWVALILVLGTLAWIVGVQPAMLVPFLAVDEASYIVYYLALMHYLNYMAGRALTQFRPLLQLNDSEFDRLEYELTTLPARSALIATGIGLVITAISFLITPADPIMADLVRKPLTQLVFLVGNAILAVFVYHTIRQLRMVSRIHASVSDLDLFRLGPVYAFSRVTARTALGWIIGLSIGLSPRIAPLLTTERLELLWVMLVPFAILVFALPLHGVHRLLVRAKTRLQDDVEQRVEVAFQRVHDQQDTDDLSNLSDRKTLLDMLLIERDLVARLSTWPWRAGTLAGFGSTLLLPLLIWLLQQLLTNWLSGR